MLHAISPAPFVIVPIIHMQSTHSVTHSISPLPLIQVSIWKVHNTLATIFAIFVTFTLVQTILKDFVVGQVATTHALKVRQLPNRMFSPKSASNSLHVL